MTQGAFDLGALPREPKPVQMRGVALDGGPGAVMTERRAGGWHRRCTHTAQDHAMGSSMTEKILIVENETEIPGNSPCGTLLHGQGYVVEIAESGAEAFAKIATHPPDLVILDAREQKNNSIEWCRRIKADAATRDIKVVIMTSSGEWGRVFEAFAAGCDDYMVEPFDRTELALKMKELFKFSHLRGGVARGTIKGTL
jgi:CheY-like chemotaxis protein